MLLPQKKKMVIILPSAVAGMAIQLSAFPPKKKTVYPEKFLQNHPSRNDAFIWQIRNFLAQDQFAEAASLIVTLRNDPVFPKRLQ